MSVKKTYNFSPLNSWMESYVNKGNFLGSSILVGLGNNIIHQHFCGFRDKANTKPFDFNTVMKGVFSSVLFNHWRLKDV